MTHLKRADAKKCRCLLIVPLIWVHLACGSMGQPAGQPVAGVYRSAHGFASIEVHLRDDGTFVYREWHDVGGWQQTEGSFRRLSPHILIANTSKPVPRSTITSHVEPYLQHISVFVRGDENIEIPGAMVTLRCKEGGESVRQTDSHGFASFPECSPDVLKVEFPDFRTATLSVFEPGAYRFEAMLVLDERWIDNERWIVLGDQLYFAPHEPLNLADDDH